MSKISFELFAPYNEAVSLTGDFNDWGETSMEKDEHGVWRTELDLEDGRYEYRFKVATKSWFYEDGERIMVSDPYARETVDDESQNSVVEIKAGRRIIGEYEWRHDEEPLPQAHETIIYELLVHDFPGHGAEEEQRGRFRDVEERLDYLSDLGVNAVELLPIEEYPGANGWGYNPRHFFSVESSYGKPADLKSLIDSCHGRGIRVIKDGVYNHGETSTPLAQIDHDYWFHHDPQDPDHNWGPEFNYEKYDENHDVMPARKFIGDVVGYWVSEFHIDGIRFDAAAQLDSFDTLRWLGDKGKEISGERPFTAIAEYIPEGPEVTKPHGPVDACWNKTFYHTMKAALTGEALDMEAIKDCLDPRRRGFEGGLRVVNYLGNHDHDHVMAYLAQAGILDEAAFKRAALGAVVLLTACGIPLIWAGQEFGNYKEKSTEATPIDWGLMDNDANQDLFNLYKGLIFLRKTNSALHGSDIDFIQQDDGLPLLAWSRWNGEGSRVVGVANFSDQFLPAYRIGNLPADGVWKDWTNDCEVESHDRVLTTDLGEWGAKVFVI